MIHRYLFFFQVTKYRMSTPSNQKLWSEVKKMADKIYSKPSAYKSGFMVKKYKELGGKFVVDHNKNIGNGRNVGYQHTNDIYRPTKKVTKATPKTWKELSQPAIEKAKKEKAKKGRVKKF